MITKRQDYKRDNLGRFATVDSASSPKGFERDKEIEVAKSKSTEQLKAELSIPLDFFAEKKKTTPSQEDVENAKRDVPKEAHSFLKERLTTAHHTRHCKDMGFKNSREYEKAAVDFWKNGEGKVFYSPAKNRYAKYNEKKKLFISVDKAGIIHTFMQFETRNRFENLCAQENLYEI